MSRGPEQSFRRGKWVGFFFLSKAAERREKKNVVDGRFTRWSSAGGCRPSLIIPALASGTAAFTGLFSATIRDERSVSCRSMPLDFLRRRSVSCTGPDPAPGLAR